jgi:hypothetical protein
MITSMKALGWYAGGQLASRLRENYRVRLARLQGKKVKIVEINSISEK